MLKDKNDLGVPYRLPVRKTDFGTKPHGLARRLLRYKLETVFDKPARLFRRTVRTFGKAKLSDFSLVVKRYCKRQEIAGLVKGQPRRMDHGIQELA